MTSKPLCQDCKYLVKGRACPIFSRLHVASTQLKLWALNQTNFGCNLWTAQDGATDGGSVLDKLDHTRRLELENEQERVRGKQNDS